MGKSKTIEELEASDKKFEEYMAGRRTEIEKRQSETRKIMDEDIEKFYREGGWDDRKPIMSASYVDVQHLSEWSLANVNTILSAVEGAVFGSSNPPPGTVVDGDIGNNPVLQAIPTLQMLVMSRAFSAIQGILEAFTTKSETNITMQKKIEVVAPGVTIFVYVNSNSFRQKSFFNNEIISQYFYMIDAYSSVQQLGDYSVFQDKALFEKEKATLRKRAEHILTKMDAADSMEEINMFSLQLDGIYDRLDKITDRINDLDKEEQVAMRGRSEQIKMRKSLALAAR